MKQVNNGYADYYYLLEDGSLYNAADDKMIQQSKISSSGVQKWKNERR